MKLKITYYFIYHILFLSLVSCNSSSQKNILQKFKDIDPEIYETDVKDMLFSNNTPKFVTVTDVSPKNIYQSLLFDTITFVRLSNDPEALIGVIDKIVIKDSSIYILDRYKTKTIKKFTLEGDFICAIGSRGEGPDEYFEPTDFNVYENEILVYDQFKSDIKYYDLEGRLKYRKMLPFIFIKFACLSPNNYIFQSVNSENGHLQSILDYAFFTSDSKFVISYRGFYSPINMYKNFIDNNFYPINKKIFYHPIYNDTIYSINNNNDINVEYVFNFRGKKLLPQEFRLEKNQNDFKEISKTDTYIIFSGAIIPTNDYLCFEYSINQLVYQGIYSIRTGKTITYSTLVNDVNPLFGFSKILTSISDDVFVGYTQPDDDFVSFFKENSKESLINHFGANLVKSMETITSEDNPLLVFYKIKKF